MENQSIKEQRADWQVNNETWKRSTVNVNSGRGFGLELSSQGRLNYTLQQAKFRVVFLGRNVNRFQVRPGSIYQKFLLEIKKKKIEIGQS